MLNKIDLIDMFLCKLYCLAHNLIHKLSIMKRYKISNSLDKSHIALSCRKKHNNHKDMWPRKDSYLRNNISNLIQDMISISMVSIDRN